MVFAVGGNGSMLELAGNGDAVLEPPPHADSIGKAATEASPTPPFKINLR